MSSTTHSNPNPSDDENLNEAPSDASEAHEESGSGVSSDLASQLEKARADAAAAQDRYLRSVADLENFRRRTVREKDDIKLFATSRVLEDLMPIIDNLSLGLAAAKQPSADLKTLTSGVDLVLQQAKTTLAAHGLKEINPLGQPFDAHQHEALSHQPSAEIPADHVSTVVRTGYSLNGRLLRPASVIISSGPAA